MATIKGVTMQQIADAAEVSTATASRVLNQPQTVKPETRNRVLQAMKKLNYQSRRRGDQVILATFSTLANPFYGLIIQGMQEAAYKRNYQLFIRQLDLPLEEQSYDFLLENPTFHGVILTHPVPNEGVLQSILAKHPVVMCSQYSDNTEVPCVVIDDYAASKNAVNYLISIGKKKIAILNAQSSYSYARFRERGFSDALTEAGLPINPKFIAHVNEADYHLAFSSIINILSEPEKPDAIFCVSDVFASAAIKAAEQLHLSVPRDVAVMGFDNISLSSMTVPAISTVNQPMYQLGWQSCNLLIDRLEDTPIITNRVVLSTDIVVRQST